MYTSHTRSVRMTLGVMLTVLAACSDEPTAPQAIPGLEPHFALGDVITVTNLSGGTAVGSLRWALGQVTGGEIIRFDPGLAGQTITLDTTIVVWGKPFTLEGPADEGITISGGGKVGVFDLDPGADGNETVLRNLTIANGTGGNGAGIVVRGRTTAWLRVENSTITGNVAAAWPAISGVSTTLVNTTVSGNTATATTNPPAVSSNRLTMVNSTVAHNNSAGVASGNLVLRNSIISNHGGKSNCVNASSLNTYEGSNISDDSTCGTVFDLTIADPQLAPLADNGGPTMTHALVAGSPAINTGASCSVGVDQRYAPRDAQCDIGAYEFLDFTTVEVTVTSSGTVDRNGWAVITGSIRCSRAEMFDLFVRLHQTQKSARSTTDVDGGAITAIACTTSARPWAVSVVASQPFEAGEALTAASLRNAEAWVTPVSLSQRIKLFKSRK